MAISARSRARARLSAGWSASTTRTGRKSYFLWGLVPSVEVDVLDKCPYGAVAIVDGSDVGGATWVPTLGLWSRRATTYYCRQPPVTQPPS